MRIISYLCLVLAAVCAVLFYQAERLGSTIALGLNTVTFIIHFFTFRLLAARRLP